ncbi:hypothetical protein llap_3493 [Limosa lapponica baueri]|uniref:Uncharacterized protein n=1 Tax=Limosa lapponica baueri TaxID=1758121 RepID=A0A2I0UJG9_LIMLA|nr:hypothetical protein llap_3493 [Limosa lapponica baueri]
MLSHELEHLCHSQSPPPRFRPPRRLRNPPPAEAPLPYTPARPAPAPAPAPLAAGPPLRSRPPVPGSDDREAEQNQNSVVFSVAESQALCQGLISTESFATSVILTILKPEKDLDTDVVIVHKLV